MAAKTTTKKKTAKKVAKKAAAEPAGPFRADGSHRDSAPMEERTVWVRITSATAVKIHCGRAAAGHETKVTPEEAKALEAQGVAKILPGI